MSIAERMNIRPPLTKCEERELSARLGSGFCIPNASRSYNPQAFRRIRAKASCVLQEYMGCAPVTLAGCRYDATHLDRYAYTLLRARQEVYVSDKVLMVGEKGSVPLLFHKLLHVNMGNLRSTSWNEAGIKTYRSRARGTTIHMELVKLDAEGERWPFPASTFDAVVMLEVVEHFARDPMAAILEAHRVLRRGGRLLVTTPNLSGFAAISSILAGWSPNMYSYFTYTRNTSAAGPTAVPHGITHTREWGVKDLDALVTSAGFKIRTHDTFTPYSGYTRDLRRNDELFRNLSSAYPLLSRTFGNTHWLVGRRHGPPRQRYAPGTSIVSGPGEYTKDPKLLLQYRPKSGYPWDP